MSISARVPRIDWNEGFARHWNGGDPAVTHAFNALSFLFPQGERFFIDVVREVVKDLGDIADPRLARSIKGFIAQESCHSFQHAKYNQVLESQGFENVVHGYVEWLQESARKHFSPLTQLAIVCGYEHYTAILGDFILSHPQVLEPAQPDMALVWGWHSAEETEHKSVCFDLYRAAGGGWLRRVLAFLLVTVNFKLMFTRLYFSLLYRDGCLKPSRILGTLGRSLRFFLGRQGIGWHLLGDALRYFAPGFHPWDQDNRGKLASWLSDNAPRLRSLRDDSGS